jgi:antitoxin HigA-1
MPRKLAPMHPGEVLRAEFLVPLGLSPGALAKACGVPRTRIERIANEETAVTADTALRLGKALGRSAQLWLNLQSEFEMRTAKSQIGKELEKITPVALPRGTAGGVSASGKYLRANSFLTVPKASGRLPCL